MSGPVPFVLQVDLSPRFFLFNSLGAIEPSISHHMFCEISCHTSQCTLFFVAVMLPTAHAIGQVARQAGLEVLFVSSLSIGVQLFFIVSFPQPMLPELSTAGLNLSGSTESQLVVVLPCRSPAISSVSQTT